MQGLTNSMDYSTYSYGLPFFNPLFPYYQYSLQTYVQNANIPYNQYSSSFALPN